MLAVYFGVALLLGASALIGQAVLVLAGRRAWSWLAPAVGFATVLVACQLSIKLPGRDTASVIVLVVLAAGAAATLWWRRPLGTGLSWLPVVLLSLLGASLPFLASQRIGLPGVSLDNDPSLHLLWADGLRTASIYDWASVVPGYPLGPHSVAATLASLTRIRVDSAFTALMLAVMAITGLCAGAALAGAALWRRTLVGIAAGLAYLAAAYYGQGSFKEPMLAMELLAFVVYVQELRGERMAPVLRIGERGAALTAARAAIPAGLLVGAGVFTFSHVAVAWFGGFLAVWLAVMVVSDPWAARRALRGPQLVPLLILAGAGLVVVAAVLLPQLSEVRTFSDSVGTDPAGHAAVAVTNLGNLPGPLSLYEAFGIWMKPDFRFAPDDVFTAGAWSAVAVGGVLIGALVAIYRREFALPAAAVGAAAIYWYSERTQSPYVTAKALVVAAPLLITLTGRGLLGWWRGEGRGAVTALRIAGGLAVLIPALYSSSLALRGSPVDPDVPAAELRTFKKVVGHHPTLFLGHDDYVGWELLGTPVANPTPEGARPIPVSFSQKPWQYGQALDWDSVPAARLDEFAYAIVPNGRYASQAPDNFRLVRHLRFYDLWRRVGHTRPRAAIDAAGAPGGGFDCHQPTLRALSRRRGFAMVMPLPVLAYSPGSLLPGTSLVKAMPLPAGKWDLSLQYTSPLALKVSSSSGLATTLPAYLGRPGPFVAVGTVTGHGPERPVPVSIYEDHPSRLTSPNSIAILGALAATAHAGPQAVPLRRACGQFVDWYRTTT